MKKFSEFNNNNKIEESKTKQDFVSKLVEESLTVQDGVIIGKDTLIETLNNVISMNDHKTIINVLENIKVQSYNGGLNFTWINETIENEKVKLNNIVLEKSNKDEMINESLWSWYIENMNAIPDMSQRIFWTIGLALGVISTTGFGVSLLSLIGMGAKEVVKELVAKLKEIYTKKDDKNIDKEELAKEVKDTINEYQDELDKMNAGEYGKKGQIIGKVLDSIKDSAEKLEVEAQKEEGVEDTKEEEKVEESLNTEDEMINENLWADYLRDLQALPDLHTQIIWTMGLVLGVVSTTGFGVTLLTLIGMGAKEVIKELVAKLKEIYKKKSDKNYTNEELAKDVKNTINEYQDELDKMKDGEYGKKGEVVGKMLDKIKDSAEKLEKEEKELEESAFYRGYKEQHTLEMESLKSIYGQILNENKNEK